MILERNFRFGKTEVDLICRDKNELVLVEVKTRSTRFFGSPISFISRAKQQNLIRAGHHYLLKHSYTYEVRFDVIGIVQAKAKPPEIEHVRRAFIPKW